MTDLFSIDGKVALVTGGSRGIGLMIARGYVEAGANVYISSRKADVCDQVAAELSKGSADAVEPGMAQRGSHGRGTCVSLPADLSEEAEVARLATELGQLEPRLHVLVNNAGATWGAPLAEYPSAAFDKV